MMPVPPKYHSALRAALLQPAKAMRRLTCLGTLILLVLPAAQVWAQSISGATIGDLHDSAAPQPRLMQYDKMKVGVSNPICVGSTVDREAKDLVENSGESLQALSFGHVETIALSYLYRKLGKGAKMKEPNAFGASSRIFDLNELSNRKVCAKSNAIIIVFHLGLSGSQTGYRITSVIKKGTKRLEAYIDRPVILIRSEMERSNVSLAFFHDAAGRPYWDVSHDAYVIAKYTVDQLHLKLP